MTQMEPRRGATCMFCGRSASQVKMSDEDVISTWIGKVLTPDLIGTKFHVDRSRVSDGKRTPDKCWTPHNLKIAKGRIVCRECNQGWMSSIEGATKPILSTMIVGSPTSLSVPDQVQIASWATLKAMTLEMLWRESNVFDQSERNLFRVTHTPAAAYWVRISTVAVDEYPVWANQKTYRQVGSHAGDALLCVTLAVGSFVVQFMKGPVLTDGSIRELMDSRQSCRTVWPPNDSVEWPTLPPLNELRLELLADPLGLGIATSAMQEGQAPIPCVEHGVRGWLS